MECAIFLKDFSAFYPFRVLEVRNNNVISEMGSSEKGEIRLVLFRQEVFQFGGIWRKRSANSKVMFKLNTPYAVGGEIMWVTKR